MISFATSKQKLLQLTEIVHLRIFGHEIGEEMRDFIGHLSWSFMGGIIAAFIMFLVNILVGRMLGPLEFGRYNYILTIASSAAVLFLLGNSSGITRVLSDRAYEQKKKSFVSASIFIGIVQSSFFLFLIYILSDWITGMLSVTHPILWLIFLISIILVFKEIVNSLLKSLFFFKQQAFLKIYDALIVLVVLSYIIFGKQITSRPENYVIAVISGGCFFVFAGLVFFWNKFGRFSFSQVRTLLHYNIYFITSAISGFLLTVDKVIIGQMITIEVLGVYSAYYASSQLVISTLGLIFLNVFVPAVIKNKQSIIPVINKLDRIFSKLFLAVVILNSLSITFFLSLYGEKYPIELSLIVLFSLSSVCNIIYYTYAGLLVIDHLSFSVRTTLLLNMFLILSLLILKDIHLYLLFQSFSYLTGIYIVRKKILN